MDKPSYKFTCYPYECSMNSSPNVLIEHTITSKDVTRTDMLVLFQHFLRRADITSTLMRLLT